MNSVAHPVFVVFVSCVLLFRHVYLRLTMILRGDARSATAQEHTSHAVTRPRMVAELVVAFTDPRSFWYSGAAASMLFWMEESVQ